MDSRPNIPFWKTWRWTVTMALIAVCLTLLTLFIADNFVVVEVRLIFFKLKMRLAWSLFFAAVLGFVIGVLTDRLKR